MEIHIVAPTILRPIGPFINLTVRMKNYGHSATTIVNVKLGDASGRKHNDITWPEWHNQTRLIQAQLAVLKVPCGNDYMEPKKRPNKVRSRLLNFLSYSISLMNHG